MINRAKEFMEGITGSAKPSKELIQTYNLLFPTFNNINEMFESEELFNLFMNYNKNYFTTVNDSKSSKKYFDKEGFLVIESLSTQKLDDEENLDNSFTILNLKYSRSASDDTVYGELKIVDSSKERNEKIIPLKLVDNKFVDQNGQEIEQLKFYKPFNKQFPNNNDLMNVTFDQGSRPGNYFLAGNYDEHLLVDYYNENSSFFNTDPIESIKKMGTSAQFKVHSFSNQIYSFSHYCRIFDENQYISVEARASYSYTHVESFKVNYEKVLV